MLHLFIYIFKTWVTSLLTMLKATLYTVPQLSITLFSYMYGIGFIGLDLKVSCVGGKDFCLRKAALMNSSDFAISCSTPYMLNLMLSRGFLQRQVGGEGTGCYWEGRAWKAPVHCCLPSTDLSLLPSQFLWNRFCFLFILWIGFNWIIFAIYIYFMPCF